MLLGAPGLTTSTRSKRATRNKGHCYSTRSKDAGAPGLTTRSKKLLGTKGIATRSKDATRGSWPYY